ncbi:hypothetical protein [Microlunatus flavus]|uniref:Htaa protein n=1 Tax=Microlunatus flavus TaxID=1036181 RepID=A0A1H9G473_9ACTN|nr:hypothetical protein [Microlunatus flavus]SEQ44975.1 hypothetical protein SAMN05421756_103492 [Microlunatus flavus]
MHHRNRSSLAAAATVLPAALLSLLLVPPAAQAAPRSPDPERLVVAQGPAPRSSVASRKAPASIDSDVYAYAISPTFRTYFVAAGHLTLSLKPGSTTKYSGSFVDYVGGSPSKAAADASDPAAPTISLKGKNGSFTFKGDTYFGGDSYSATATKVSSKLGIKAKDVYLAAAKHSVKTATYSIVLTERSGPVNRPFEYSGSLTIAYDANNRISGGQVTVTGRKGKNVTNALKNSGYFGTSYFYTVAKVDKTSMGISGTFDGPDFSGFGFAGSGSKTTQWVVSGTP